MGTDWRDNDPQVEPIVEIYQGDRNSYEALGGPRVARKPAEAIGGFKPLGMVWNALAMGYRLGFQASSDHWSTHISYAVALAEEHTRPAILDAFRQRHCYAATDNILLDVRMGEHIMGDEFVLKRADKADPVGPRARHGAVGPSRGHQELQLCLFRRAQAGRRRIQLDRLRCAAGHELVLRAGRADRAQLAWASPIWVRIPAARPGAR